MVYSSSSSSGDDDDETSANSFDSSVAPYDAAPMVRKRPSARNRSSWRRRRDDDTNELLSETDLDEHKKPPPPRAVVPPARRRRGADPPRRRDSASRRSTSDPPREGGVSRRPSGSPRNNGSRQSGSSKKTSSPSTERDGARRRSVRRDDPRPRSPPGKKTPRRTSAGRRKVSLVDDAVAVAVVDDDDNKERSSGPSDRSPRDDGRREVSPLQRGDKSPLRRGDTRTVVRQRLSLNRGRGYAPMDDEEEEEEDELSSYDRRVHRRLRSALEDEDEKEDEELADESDFDVGPSLADGRRSAQRRRRARGRRQFLALWSKHWIVKRRSPVSAALELLVPVLAATVLRAAHRASPETREPARVHDVVDLEVPGPFVMGRLFRAGLPPRGAARADDDEDDDEEEDERSPTDAWSADRRGLDALARGPLPVPTLGRYEEARRLLSARASADDARPRETDRAWGHLLADPPGTIHVVGALAEDFVAHARSSVDAATSDLDFATWDDVDAALERAENQTRSDRRAWAIVDLSEVNEEDTSDVRYTIRMNDTVVPPTTLRTGIGAAGYDDWHESYHTSGYTALQRTVNEFFLARRDCPVLGDTGVFVTPMPTGLRVKNDFHGTVGRWVGPALLAAFLVPIARSVGDAVGEVETGTRRALSTAGASPGVSWWSRCAFALVWSSFAAALASAVLWSRPWARCDGGLVFATVWLFSTCATTFSLCAATLFSRARSASTAVPLLLIASALPRYGLLGATGDHEAVALKATASLLPGSALAFAADTIDALEDAGVGLRWWSARTGGFDVRAILIEMAAATVLYAWLGWYLDQVVPREGAPTRPWNFLWRGRRGGAAEEIVEEEPLRAKDHARAADDDRIQTDCDEGSVPVARLLHAVKSYGRAKALNDLTLSLYSDRVTCLLGPNGAGKSTALSALAGATSIDDGNALVGDASLRDRSWDEIRIGGGVGVCPQRDALYDDLTVIEHLRLFLSVKTGVAPTDKEVRERADEVDGLASHLYVPASALSTGLRRKLSLAIALCGDPRLLLLDEPTNGVDPASRLAVWELLRRKAMGRAVLLTTHSAEEAESLADRVAVLRKGKLRCYGTTAFLRRAYGLGYDLTVRLSNAAAAKDDDDDERRRIRSVRVGRGADDDSSSLARRSRPVGDERAADVLAVLREYVADVREVRRRRTNDALVFRTPPGCEAALPDLLDALDDKELDLGAVLGLRGPHGVTRTTLEEAVAPFGDGPGDDDDSDASDTAAEEASVPSSEDTNSYDNRATIGQQLGSVVRHRPDKRGPKERASALLDHFEEEKDAKASFAKGGGVDDDRELGFFAQIAVLLRKRWTVQRRDRTGLVAQVLLPVAAVAVALLFLALDAEETPPPLELSDVRLAGSRVLVGGRRAVGEPSMNDTFRGLADGLAAAGADAVRAEDALDSAALSRRLVADAGRVRQYGALVFHDAIDVDVQIDWGDLRHALHHVDPATVGRDGVLEWRGRGRQYVTLRAVATTVYSRPDKDPGTAIDLIKLENLLHRAVDSSNATADAITNANTVVNIIFNGLRNAETLEEMFDTINTITGGSEGELDASYLITWDSVAVNLVRNDVTVNNLNFTFVDADAWLRSEKVVLTLAQNNSVLSLYGFEADGELGDMELSQFIEKKLKAQPIKTTYALPNEEQTEAFLRDFFDNFTYVDLGDPRAPGDGLLRFAAYLLPDEDRASLYFQHLANVTCLHNVSSPHAVAAVYQTYAQHAYRECVGDGRARLVAVNHPLPRTRRADVGTKARKSALAALFVLLPFCHAPAALATFVVRERTSGARRAQLLAGVDVLAYWTSTYLWDMFLWTMFTIASMIVFLCYGLGPAEVFVGTSASASCTFFLTFGYGTSALPFAYVISRYFDDHNAAQVSVLAAFVVTGVVAVLANFALESAPETVDLATTLRAVFHLFPAFNVGDGFLSLARNYFAAHALGSDVDPFRFDVAGAHVAYLFGLSMFYFGLLIFLEYSADGGSGGCAGVVLRSLSAIGHRCSITCAGVVGTDLVPDREPRPDVTEEEERVLEHADELRASSSVLMVNLWRIFPPSVGCAYKFLTSVVDYPFSLFRDEVDDDDDADARSSMLATRAVQGTSLAVREGETFGLLGVNGAGKSTTMAVLTGDLAPTDGEAYVAGYDVTGKDSGGVAKARKHIGLCPQTDPLLESMTARETLTMYGQFRGIPNDKIDTTVDHLIDALTLKPWADKEVGLCSAGNKRKISLGIAMIGDPRVLFIDEASSGMDPVARRRMWELLSVISKKRCVILSTQLMEEAEALCSRIGIMVAGQMICLGSVQHLKSTMLDGYTVDMQCEPDTSDEVVDNVVYHMTVLALPGTVVEQRCGRFLQFSIPNPNSSLGSSGGGLGNLFRELQNMKNDTDLKIENYSIAQRTLEQAFLKLVKGEKEKKDVDMEEDIDDESISMF